MTATQTTRPSAAPFVKLYEATPDPIGFFEAVLGFGRLAGQWIRISAADQRRFFGCVPFGKLAIRVEEGGKIKEANYDLVGIMSHLIQAEKIGKIKI